MFTSDEKSALSPHTNLGFNSVMNKPFLLLIRGNTKPIIGSEWHFHGVTLIGENLHRLRSSA